MNWPCGNQRDAGVSSGVHAHAAHTKACSISVHDQRLSLSTREKAFHSFLVITTRSFSVGTGSRGWDLEALLQKSFIFFQPRVKRDFREGKTNETPGPGDLMQEASGALPRQQVVAHLTLLA